MQKSSLLHVSYKNIFQGNLFPEKHEPGKCDLIAPFRSIEAVGGRVAFKATSTESITTRKLTTLSSAFFRNIPSEKPYVFTVNGSKGLLYNEQTFSYTTRL